MPDALLIVDYQNDFIPGGALGVEGGDAIVEHINELARSGRFDIVVATRDWHPPDHGSFTERGGPWPEHCVQGSRGAELHAELDRTAIDLVIDKGHHQATDGYSAFEDTDLGDLLRGRGIDSLTIVGLATDYCVKNSALDALAEGFDVHVELEAVRGVDVKAGDSERALEEIRQAGGSVGVVRP